MQKPEATEMVAKPKTTVKMIKLPDGSKMEEAPKTESKADQPNVQVRLLRDHHLEGQNFVKGTILEVDADTAEKLTKKFQVPYQFFGNRPVEEIGDEVKYSAIAVRV